ncbi:MAG: hypothetical protein PVG30_09185 [Gammaproteobacteria bacterium]|jgi:hypothetical protein
MFFDETEFDETEIGRKDKNQRKISFDKSFTTESVPLNTLRKWLFSCRNTLSKCKINFDGKIDLSVDKYGYKVFCFHVSFIIDGKFYNKIIENEENKKIMTRCIACFSDFREIINLVEKQFKKLNGVDKSQQKIKKGDLGDKFKVYCEVDDIFTKVKKRANSIVYVNKINDKDVQNFSLSNCKKNPAEIAKELLRIKPEHFCRFFIDGALFARGETWIDYDRRRPGDVEGLFE